MGWQLFEDLAPHIALNERYGNEGRQTQSDRHQHQRRGCAWPVQVGEPETGSRRSDVPAGTGSHHDCHAAEAEQSKGAQRCGAEPQRQAPVGSGGNGQSDQRGYDAGNDADEKPGRTHPLRDEGVTEQRGAGNASSPRERP